MFRNLKQKQKQIFIFVGIGRITMAERSEGRKQVQ